MIDPQAAAVYRERLGRSQEFQSLKGHPGYTRFLEEVRLMLASYWEGFLVGKPEDLPQLQARAQGVKDVLGIVDEACLDAGRVIQEQEAKAEQDRVEAESHQSFLSQGTLRGRRMGARL
jgi:hypothetical protein